MKSFLPSKFENIPIEIIIPLLIGFLLRIPRIPHPSGFDSFVVAYESQLIIEGYFFKWAIHPASLFQLFPFSSYPIGILLVFSVFLILSGGSIDLAVFMYSTFCLIFTTVAVTLFLREIVEDKTIILIGNTIYSLTPILFSFSYFMSNSRMMIFALAPLQFYYIIKAIKNNNTIDLSLAFFVTIFMFFFHRIALPFAIFFMVSFILFFLYHLWKKIPTDKSQYRILLIQLFMIIQIMFGLFWFIATESFITIHFKNSIEEVEFISQLDPELIVLCNFFFDYFLFWGPVVILTGIGLILFIFDIFSIKSNAEISNFLPHLILFSFLMIMLPFLLQTPYTRHILIPVLLPFTLLPIRSFLDKKMFSHFILSICFLSVTTFFTLFHIFLDDLGIYIFIIWFIFCLYVLYFLFSLIPNKFSPVASKQFYKVLFLLLLISANSMVLLDMRTVIDRDDSFPYPYLSDEEITVSEFIKMNIDREKQPFVTVFATHYLVELRIGTCARTLILSDSHGVNLLITGTLEKEDVLEKSKLKPIEKWISTSIFNYIGAYQTPRRLWLALHKNPYDNDTSQDIIKQFNIVFFIKFRSTNNSEFLDGGVFPSIFAETIPENLLVLKTTNLLVYHLLKSNSSDLVV